MPKKLSGFKVVPELAERRMRSLPVRSDAMDIMRQELSRRGQGKWVRMLVFYNLSDRRKSHGYPAPSKGTWANAAQSLEQMGIVELGTDGGRALFVKLLPDTKAEAARRVAQERKAKAKAEAEATARAVAEARSRFEQKRQEELAKWEAQKRRTEAERQQRNREDIQKSLDELRKFNEELQAKNKAKREQSKREWEARAEADRRRNDEWEAKHKAEMQKRRRESEERRGLASN